MRRFTQCSPAELRVLLVEVTVIPGSFFLLVLVFSGVFEPEWARSVVGVSCAGGLASGLLARHLSEVTARFAATIAGAATLVTTLLGLAIQPADIATLTAYLFVGIVVTASAFLSIRSVIVLSIVSDLLGLAVIALRAPAPALAGLLFVGLMTLCLVVVSVLRLSLQSARDEAVSLALADSLTGLANRRSMELNVPRMNDLAERADQRLGCLLLDLDAFKAVNDTYGHLAGDDLLKLAANALGSVTRSSDLCVRIGGDEFAVFSVVRDHSELADIGERIRVAVELYSRQNHDISPPATVSIGGSLAPATTRLRRESGGHVSGFDLDQLIRLSDRALYQAKSAGRNVVQID